MTSDGPLAAGRLAALDLLATMVALVRRDGAIVYANAAFEDAAGVSRHALARRTIDDWFADPRALRDALDAVLANRIATARFDALMRRSPPAIHDLPVQAIVAQVEFDADCALIELIEIEQQTRQERDERAIGQVQASRELIRNLAHEIRNPLGGIRGAAQLLAMQIDAREQLECTEVIIHEVDRLRTLVDRLLAPHRQPRVVGDVNVHELCERVRALVLAEFPHGLALARDYDTSLPELRGDREQLIQALLNIVRNAAQALQPRIAAGDARIVLRTRVARQVTIGKQRHRLALELQVEDNGPGVPDEIRDRIFLPLVSGREDGSGLGLTLAQTFVQQHQGSIEFDSMPGRTVFCLVLPLP